MDKNLTVFTDGEREAVFIALKLHQRQLFSDIDALSGLEDDYSREALERTRAYLKNTEGALASIEKTGVGCVVRDLVKQAWRAWENLDLTQGNLAEALFSALESVEEATGLDENQVRRE